MSIGTLRISLSQEQLDAVLREVASGEFPSSDEVVGEALAQWLRRRRISNVGSLEKLHAGAWKRDTTQEELDAIIKAQRRARPKPAPNKGRRHRHG